MVALLEHPQVAEVAVAGIPDSDLGERTAAWVVPRGGARPSESELAHHVGSLLSSHERPPAFYFVDELPRNTMGKVMKTRLQLPGQPDG